MLHDIGDVRLSTQAKEQLIRLKRVTGIKNWNVLCRWALCTSLADPSPPLIRSVVTDSNVEMSWRTFTGADETVYLSLLVERAHREPLYDGSTATLLSAHLHRGVGMLAGDSGGSLEALATRTV